MRIGIFGGSFNPPHNGHLNSAQQVLKLGGLEKIHVIVANQNPLKIPVEGPTAQQRLAMTQLAFATLGSQFYVDDQEIKRGGKSYMIDTVRALRKETPAEDLFLVIGLDQFDALEDWKNFEELLAETNVIVTSRPGYDLPKSEEELPVGIARLVAAFDFNYLELKTGRNIQFIHLKDFAVSATELRKSLRVGKNVQKFIPLSVENYIRENKLYQPIGERIGDYKKFTEFCAKILFDKKGIKVCGYDLRKMAAPSEFALIASGTSTRHTSALAENVLQAVKEEFNILPQAVEGLDEGRWVVVDYGSLIVHIFYDFVRREYSLESLWKEATDMGLVDLSVKAETGK